MGLKTYLGGTGLQILAVLFAFVGLLLVVASFNIMWIVLGIVLIFVAIMLFASGSYYKKPKAS
jgi:predicted membrane protein